MYFLQIRKIVRIMKLTALLILVALLQVSAKSDAQTVTLSVKNSPLQSVLAEIKRQTGYEFFFNESMLESAKPITLNVKNAPLEEVLKTCFENQPFSYSIVLKTVVLKDKPATQSQHVLENLPPGDIRGRVTDSLGNPLSGASVFVKGTKRGTTTDVNGNFELKGVNENVTLTISYTGFTNKEYKWTGDANFHITLIRSSNPLDAVVVIPYGTTTQRLNTGDVGTVTSKTIEQQPVPNVLAAMEGQVPGLVITQNTGLPGGSFNVQIRGRNSLVNGNDPFYVVDGVPYGSQLPGLLINTSLKGGSPLNYIDPFDIESVEVLKDADATAIYGSRAANGAILITTKKGKQGPMKIDFNFYTGVTQPGHDIDLMNTQQYLAMRHEAFTNDGKTPGPRDYDINGVWDTTRYTNWSKVLTENPAYYTNLEASASGGAANTQWLIGAGYNSQTTGFPTLIPGDGRNQSASVHFNLNSMTADKRFKLTLTASYLSNNNTVQSRRF